MEPIQLPPNLERQVLRGVLKAIDERPEASRKLHWLLDLAIWVVVAVALFFLFQIFGSSGWFQTLFPFVTFGFGMFFMHVYLKAQRVVQWPLIGKYVDRQKIEARINELGA